MEKQGYENTNLWVNTPETIEEFVRDHRFKKLNPLAKDAAVAKYLNMSYGKLQEYKALHNLTW